jgi:hypothetical protein
LSVATIAEEAFRGETIVFEVTVIRDGVLEPFDSNTYTMWCTAKRSRTHTDAQAVFQITDLAGPLGGISVSAPGVLRVQINPAATDVLSLHDTRLQMDVKFQLPDGISEFVAASGEMLIKVGVTNA